MSRGLYIRRATPGKRAFYWRRATSNDPGAFAYFEGEDACQKLQSWALLRRDILPRHWAAICRWAGEERLLADPETGITDRFGYSRPDWSHPFHRRGVERFHEAVKKAKSNA